MRIRFWGTRGSIPSCGKPFVKYGGHTTCVELRSALGKLIVIDAGTGIRNLGISLAASCPESFSMLFTHSHLDHISGFPFFLPIFKKNIKISLFSLEGDLYNPIKEITEKTMNPPIFPLSFKTVPADFSFHCIKKGINIIEGINVFPIELSHPDGGVGFRFEENGKSFVFLTDNELGHKHCHGHVLEEYAEFCKGADFLAHDAQYTEEEYKSHKTWGHSTPAQAIKLAKMAGVKKLCLFHHDPGRSDSELDSVLADLRKINSKSGYGIECMAAMDGQSIEI